MEEGGTQAGKGCLDLLNGNGLGLSRESERRNAKGDCIFKQSGWEITSKRPWLKDSSP